MKNTYKKPELLMTLVNIKDVLTLSANNAEGHADNDQAAFDLEIWPD